MTTPEQLARWRKDAEHGPTSKYDPAQARRILALLDEVERLTNEIDKIGDANAGAKMSLTLRAEKAEALVAAKDAEIEDLVRTVNAQGAALAECRLLLLLKDAETYTLREKDAEVERWKKAAVTADAARAGARSELIEVRAKCAGLSDLAGDYRVARDEARAALAAVLSDYWRAAFVRQFPQADQTGDE